MLGELLKKTLQLYVDRQVMIIEDDKREALAHQVILHNHK